MTGGADILPPTAMSLNPSPDPSVRADGRDGVRWGALALAGAASAVASSAHGAVISQTGLNIAVPNDGQFHNLGVSPIGLPSVFTGREVASSVGSVELKNPGVSSPPALTSGSISPGDVVGPATSLVSTIMLASYSQTTLNLPTTTPVIGLKLSDGSFPSNTGYGWVSFSITDNGPGNYFNVAVTGWGYETSGAAITYSPVPSPSTLALAAAGLLGGAMVRRRRARRTRPS
jgi:hypothetical protein